jgi:nucleoside-diphosphate-sugar epimerase
MRVLVTGGWGFIGSHLAERLLAEGHDVRILDNGSTGHRGNVEPFVDDLEVIEGDIQSYERVHNAVAGCDIVMHEAALPSVPRSIQDPLTSNASNVVGTLNVLLASRDSDARRVVFASSSSIYGANPELPKHEGLIPMPISPYAVAKLAGEGYCRSFWEVYGLETVALRYFNVFGPRQDPLSQYASVIPKFTACFLEDESPTVYGDGEQSRDFTYIDNVVEANVQAMTAEGVAGTVMNVACGERITLNQMLDHLRQLTGKQIEARYVDPRPGDVQHSLADITRAREKIGFNPTVSFEEGLVRALESHRTSSESALGPASV